MIIIILSIAAATIVVYRFWPKAEKESQSNTTANKTSSQIVKDIVKNSPEWYTKYLQTFLTLNFEPFENVKSIDNKKLLTFGVLKEILTLDGALTIDTNGNTIVKCENISKNIEQYFNIKPVNESIEDFITYDEHTQTFSVVPIGFEPSYMTVISSINNISDNKIEVEIEFYEYSYDNTLKKDNKILKKMKLTLSNKSDKYIIQSYKKL